MTKVIAQEAKLEFPMILPATAFRRRKAKGMKGFMTHDSDPMAFTFRMGAGYAGQVNRFHFFDIEACLIDVNAPPTLYGQAVVVDPTTNGVRPVAAGDTALTDAYGFTTRPYPLQQNSVSPNFGDGVPPTSGVIDILRVGYIMSKVNGAVTKGGTVYIWVAASTGNHIQGYPEAGATGGSTIALDPHFTTFNGPADSNNICEIIFHV